MTDYFRGHGFPAAARIRTPGREADRGDVGGITDRDGDHWSVEAKNQARIDLPGWWRQVEATAARSGGWPVLIAKRKGFPDPADAYAVVKLADFLALAVGPDDHQDDRPAP